MTPVIDKNIQTANPGSPEAQKQGCTCPVIDNCYGKGFPGPDGKPRFYTYEGCPLHDAKDDRKDAMTVTDAHIQTLKVMFKDEDYCMKCIMESENPDPRYIQYHTNRRDALLAVIEHVEATPKTADGVRIRAGMELWGNPKGYSGGQWLCQARIPDVYLESAKESIPLTSCFSTESAALAAKGIQT